MKKLSLRDIKQNSTMYTFYHKKLHMEDGWFPENKYTNYELLSRITEFTGIPLSGTSCLDVGCGTGDFSLFLRKRGIKIYLGIDIYKPSLQKAQKKYPDETFLETDLLAFSTRKKFQYVFCSGALTVKLKDIEQYEFFHAAISKMWKLSKIGIAVNVLLEGEPFTDPGLWFYNRDKVEDICRTIAPNETLFIEKTPGIHQIHIYMFRNTPQIS